MMIMKSKNIIKNLKLWKKSYASLKTQRFHRGTPPVDKTRSILEFTFYTGKIQWSNETVLINL